MPDSDRLQKLFDGYLEGSLTPDEKLELMGLWLEPSLQPEILSLLESIWNGAGEAAGLTEDELQVLFQRAFNENTQAPVVPLKTNDRKWRRWIAAASIILAVGLGLYFLWPQTGQPTKPVTEIKTDQDVPAPTSTKAMITLGDGKKVYLDSINSGAIATQGNTTLIKLADGQIAYQSQAGDVLKQITYNTLTNPRGSKVIDMTLADGSRVWLNAGSSIRYPVAFQGVERRVSITGEAYFEVAHNLEMPFMVNKDEMEVTVLGTHFNVNSYDDETDIKVTLLEGSVYVAKAMASVILKPGQQAHVSSDIHIAAGVDTDAVMAWKNGYFSFSQTQLTAVMRQIARWYDVEVSYEGHVPDRRFRGEISRNSSVSEVLKILEESKVHFRLEGRRIVVMP